MISEPKDTALDITSLEDLPDAISASQMELVTKKVLAEAGRLSQIEAREAFVTYLRRLQLRFLNAANENVKDTNISKYLINYIWKCLLQWGVNFRFTLRISS